MAGVLGKSAPIYMPKAKWPEGAPAQWMTLNTSIGAAEGQVRAYLARAKGKVDIDPKTGEVKDYGKTTTDKKFWLAWELDQHDIAGHLALQRDSIKLPTPKPPEAPAEAGARGMSGQALDVAAEAQGE